MNLRDYFAAAALQAQFGFPESIKEVPAAAHKRNMTSEEYVAFASYLIADAMIKEREKSK